MKNNNYDITTGEPAELSPLQKMYLELKEIIEPRLLDDFCGYNEETQGFDLFLATKQIIQAKEQECEELYNEKMKLIDKSIEQKCKIRELIDENAIKEVVYKINGKCAKTVANKVKEIRKIVEGKDCKWSKYKQALDEIEKFASKHCISTDDYNKIRNNKWVYAFSKGYSTARWELINPILNIINKAKEV